MEYPMKNQLRNVITLAAIMVCFLFVVFVINQTTQVVALANSIDPRLGKFALYALLAVYAGFIIAPLYLLIRLPKPLRPPQSQHAPEFEAFLASLQGRLRSNPHLRSLNLTINNQSEVEEALKILETKANEVIQKTASTIFVSTAISQSGRLDAFVVLAAQARMIWQIAQIYNQRPALRDLAQLYANVGATTFLAMELEELDIGEQIEPMVANVLGGSLASLVPGVNVVATLVTNAILDGTANAFLTLRVGAITKRYCGALVASDRKSIRRSTCAEAAQMLGAVVLAPAGKISKAIWDTAKKKTKNASLSKFYPFKSKPDESKQTENFVGIYPEE
jgi:hypothetical protein